MMQFIYNDKIFLCGKISDVTKQLKELSLQYRTVKELLDGHTAIMEV